MFVDSKDLKVLIKKCEEQERTLQFDRFTNKDALTLGMMLVEHADENKFAVVIDINVNGYQLFRYGFTGTNIHNDMWINRKINTVNTVHKSTLHTGAILMDMGEDIGTDWHLDPNDYAFHGGGFPITLKGAGVIGSICVSGMPHEQDHQIIIDVLEKYFEKDVN